MPALAGELVALRVDLIVAASVQAISATVAATRTIPVVFAGAADPVASGFVKSLSKPGGNVTGLSTLSGDLGGKQIELLRAVVPRLARIALLVSPANNSRMAVLNDFEAVAQKEKLTILPFEALTPDAIDRAFPAMVAARADAVVVAVDGMFLQQAGRIATLALRHKLPLISTQQQDAEAGSLMSYGATLAGNYHRAATYVDKILKGAKPADLPVEQPTRIELTLNLKTAKALGIKIPQALMLRADRFIE